MISLNEEGALEALLQCRGHHNGGILGRLLFADVALITRELKNKRASLQAQGGAKNGSSEVVAQAADVDGRHREPAGFFSSPSIIKTLNRRRDCSQFETGAANDPARGSTDFVGLTENGIPHQEVQSLVDKLLRILEDYSTKASLHIIIAWFFCRPNYIRALGPVVASPGFSQRPKGERVTYRAT